MIKIGDTVVCIRSEGSALMLGEKYVVTDIKSDDKASEYKSISIGTRAYYFATRFRNILELRDEKINNILM